MKTTKMLAGLVGVAGMLVSGVVGAQDPVITKSTTVEDYENGERQINNCGCNFAQNWNVPEGAAVVGRSQGFFKSIIDQVGESATHIMLYRGKMEGSDVPWVVHSSAYQHNLMNRDEDGDIVRSDPLRREQLGFNGPGTSRISVAGTYEYFHPYAEAPMCEEIEINPYNGSVSCKTLPECLMDRGEIGLNNLAGTTPRPPCTDYPVVKVRFQPEYIRYSEARWVDILTCKTEDTTSKFINIRCVPSINLDTGAPNETCWREDDPSATYSCTEDATGEHGSAREWEGQVNKFIAANTAEPSAYGDHETIEHYQDRLKEHLAKAEAQGRPIELTALDTDPIGDPRKLKICTRQGVSEWSTPDFQPVCYSRRVNLGLEAAKRTDSYESKAMPAGALYAGGAPGKLGSADVNDYAVRSSLHQFQFARDSSGTWGYQPSSTRNPDGFLSPYYLHQYVDIEGANEGYATPGMACSTFLSFLQVQSSRLAYQDALVGKGYDWDKGYNAIRTKTYSPELIASTAHNLFAFVYKLGISNGVNNDLCLLPGMSAHCQAEKEKAATRAANMILNCILIGPDDYGCNNQTFDWQNYIYPASNKGGSTISADWMIGRTSFQINDNGVWEAVGGMNPYDSIWAKWFLLTKPVEYSSEGRVCTCW